MIEQIRRCQKCGLCFNQKPLLDTEKECQVSVSYTHLQFMIYDIVISDQAEIDLRGIFEYIVFELQAPENASGQFDRLEACIMDLDHMPKRYR